MEHWNRGWGVAYKGDMKVESGMEWNTGMEPGGGGVMGWGGLGTESDCSR